MARGKTSSDASDLEKLEWPYDWPPPWRRERLLGHEAAEKTMLAAYRSGRLHHAWLLAGPRGIGKATLAWRFARFLLSGAGEGGLFGGGPESLDVAAGAPGRALVDARSHPDLFHLRRTLNPDTARMRAEIAVDDVRELGAFMHMTPAMGKWRVAIVDAADEMNRNSANAVLKILEEPPPNAVLLMVAHMPGRLLPTIRSRCRRLALQSLQPSDIAHAVADVLERDASEGDIKAASLAADGSVARALDLTSGSGLAVREKVNAMLGALPAVNPRDLHALGDALGRGNDAAYVAFVDAVRDWLSARIIVKGAEPSRLIRMADVWDRLNRAAREVETFNLERKPMVFNVFGWLAEAARG